mgnify:CR=1 FL=1
MTYLNTKDSQIEFIEYKMSSTQAVDDDVVIKFDSATKRTTGGDAVSYDSTTGILTLSSSRRYWVQASMVIDRGSNSAYSIEWIEDSSYNRINPSDGGFRAIAQRTAISSGNYLTSSHVAHLMVDNPSIGYRLNFDTGPASDVMTLTNLFIIEARN